MFQQLRLFGLGFTSSEVEVDSLVDMILQQYPSGQF